MPPFVLRSIISTLLVVHLSIITGAMLAHRGASYLLDDMLSIVAPYTAFGNWRMDTNRLPIANNNQLEETIRIEYHQRDQPADAWVTLMPAEPSRQNRTRSLLTREQRLEQHWLQQLSGLLFYDNDEGVGQMLMTALRPKSEHGTGQMDKVRVTVAPRLSLEQHAELEINDDPTKLPEAYRPQVAYLASVIDLGDGQLSLLRQMEARRASKAISPPSKPSAGGGDRP
jgi:hypothetical protein